MQVPSKVYLQLISRWRSLHDLILPNDDDDPISLVLIYAAAVLALLLAILEIDVHQDQLRWIGLLGDNHPALPMFMIP